MPALNTEQRERLIQLSEDLHAKASALLNKVENITTEDFSRGGEKKERAELRQVLEIIFYGTIPQRGMERDLPVPTL